MTSIIKVEKDHSIAVLTIDNPPLNVMNHQVLQELKSLFIEIENDQDVIAIILTGAGERTFMAGADIKEFPSLIGKKGIKENFMLTHQILDRIDNCSKPTIAVLNGLTLGGGCELALTCDIRIAEEHVSIGLPEIKLGLFPGGGGTQRLPRAVGEARAKEMMFTGTPIDAKKAERIGLVNEVVPKGEGLNKALEMARQISQHSLQALSRIKKAVDEGLSTELSKGINREAELFEEVFQTDDIKEGVGAFIEKRKPVFIHR
ncbi:enoyl-CoA hydratase [Metabacillus litoralis]|uniref:enoyl-CoA hydratase n=1 Tax=Metabacillus TaxID=2675233 RepID=UPI0015D597EA|nr:enoyl-CoA hydratase [Metabacillus litoralis]MCM3160215.1 enoyl-CoA hydratase [Metabacillus litoralis]UHA59543.1 enoyl-CoA hydratase [Metabacillus litoralis]